MFVDRGAIHVAFERLEGMAGGERTEEGGRVGVHRLTVSVPKRIRILVRFLQT